MRSTSFKISAETCNLPQSNKTIRKNCLSRCAKQLRVRGSMQFLKTNIAASLVISLNACTLTCVVFISTAPTPATGFSASFSPFHSQTCTSSHLPRPKESSYLRRSTLRTGIMQHEHGIERSRRSFYAVLVLRSEEHTSELQS